MTTQLKNALSSGVKIGHLTWYDCRTATITPAKLKRLFDQYGLNNKYFPGNIKPKNAFQKACRHAMVKDSTSSDTRGSVTKLISDNMDKIIYGVVDLDVNTKEESINPDFCDRVWLDKESWNVHYNNGHAMSVRIKDIYNQLCGEYITRDISRMITQAMDKMCSVSLRDAGVIYFVPLAFENELIALQNVVNSIGQCNMRVFEIGASNASSIEVEAKSEIQNKITKMKDDIADLKMSIIDGTIKGKTVEKSIEVRLRRYQDLKEKCEILADALKIKADSLTTELKDVGNLIKAELVSAA